MSSPLISVITPTWQRHDALLERCIPSVRAQTWPEVEHIVVSDGPDPQLRDLVAGQEGFRFAELPRHDPYVRWGTRARLHGIELAKGELVAYLDDDNAFHPEHLDKVAGALIANDTDFAYSRMTCYRSGAAPYEVGAMPPVYGQIDTSLIVHRRDLLDKASWRYFAGLPTIDWDIVERWLVAGATWAFVPELTLDYHFS